MKYRSTRGKKLVSARTAILEGLPADNGLYVPEAVPTLHQDEVKNFSGFSIPEIAHAVTKHFLEPEISAAELQQICEDAFNFPLEIKQLEANLHVLELFHGPTLAFKDFGARFMARVMSHFVKDEDKELHILVATSGDTGGAVGSGFLNVAGIRVTILYPKGKISARQEAQITTLGNNVNAIEINGTFDDCQHLVKSAFLDQNLRNEVFLSSANSINISRLIPQSVYYFACQAQLQDEELVFVVPSGNLGNISAGIMGNKMGLPAERFVAAVNTNKTFTDYLASGSYEPRPSKPTLSNAMDVGNPSNIQRLDHWLTLEEMKNMISSFSFNDHQTLEAIRSSIEKYSYDMCPHTAVALLGANRSRQSLTGTHVILSTAHPAKFSEELQDIPYSFDIPATLSEAMVQEKKFISMQNDFGELKDYLLS